MKQILKILAITLLGVLLIILILGFLPASVDGLESDSDPMDDYDEAVRRFEEFMETEKGIVNDDGFSLLMTHGDKTERAYVLIHGTTNSPLQFKELGQILHERGYNVLIMRMPHHGLVSHSVSELKSLKAEELREYADSSVDIATGLGDEIYVVGLSGGGAVASWIAQNRSDVERILLLSPFFGIPEVPAILNTFLMNLFLRVPNIVLQNPTEPQRGWVYRGEATRGVAEFMRLGRGVFGEAENFSPEVMDPLFITTAVDDTADNELAKELANIWQKSGAKITSFEFDEDANIPHNSIDPSADPAKKALVYSKILELLGEDPLD